MNDVRVGFGWEASKKLSDAALLAEVSRVSRAHRVLTAELVAHLAEMDRRKLYLREAAPSLFVYCVKRLGFSEDEACRRIDAARMVQKWPKILQKIGSGELSLTVLGRLKSCLKEDPGHTHRTDADVCELVEAVSGLSVREAEQVLATRFPKPDVPDSIRKLPDRTRGSRGEQAPLGSTASSSTSSLGTSVQGQAGGVPMAGPEVVTERKWIATVTAAAAESATGPRTSTGTHAAGTDAVGTHAVATQSGVGTESGTQPVATQSGAGTESGTQPVATQSGVGTESGTQPVAGMESATNGCLTRARERPATRPVDRGRFQPLSAERIQVKFTASRVLEEKIALARDLMSHRNPRGDLATILEAAVDLLIEELQKKKLGVTRRPQKNPRKAQRDRVTSRTRREVLERDGLGCAFVNENGERCGARAFLELDHRKAKGVGGGPEPENMRWLCRAHNQAEAERVYRKAHMERSRRRRRGKKKCDDVVRERTVTGEFVVGFVHPRQRGYSSLAGRSGRAGSVGGRSRTL